MFRTFCLVSFFLASVSPVKAGIITSFDYDPQHRAEGAEVDAVGALVGHRPDGTMAFIGSMSMIDHHNGVGTIHNLFPDQFTSYSVRMGSNFFNDFTSFNVSSVLTHPSYSGLGSGLDLALLRFETPVTGITPLTLYTGPHIIGDTYKIVGFGRVGVPGGDLTLDGEKRLGYNNLEGFSFEDDYLRFRFDPTGSSNNVEGELLFTVGYSGGAILNMADQLSALPAAATDSIGFASLITDEAVKFINTNKFQPTSVPEPGSIFLFGSATMGFLIKRWRRKAQHEKVEVA